MITVNQRKGDYACTPTCAITNDDLWSAIRGLDMYKLSQKELTAIMGTHTDNGLFESKVIYEAARQVRAINGYINEKK